MQPVRVLIALPATEARALAAGLSAEPGVAVELVDLATFADSPALAHACEIVVADASIGAEVLARAVPGGPAVILVAAFGSVSEAVDAIRDGAFDYLSRPVSTEQLAVCVRRAAEKTQLASENARLRDSLENRYRFENLVTRDASLRRVLEIASSVAATRANVLITGESGTGKTLLARALHAASERRDGPFVEVNCGALPPSLLESELFGHAKGAFTGAVADKLGRFEAADGGTLFLDEIGTTPLEVQVKLLRILQDRAFERLGETRTRTADVRLVCATNEDLTAAVAGGRFREDLYYRIDVVRLAVPPLRQRPGDVALLASAFLDRYRKEYDRPIEGIAPEALTALAACPWPGNVRQLENAIERAALMAPGPELQRADLDLGPPGGSASRPRSSTEPGSSPAADPDLAFASLEFPVPSLKKALEAPEKAIIERALALARGNRKATARMLGVNRTTLFNKMRKYGLLDGSDEHRLDRSA